MPGRGSSTFRRSIFWVGASLAAVLIGLVMLMHEQHGHDLCVATLHILSRKPIIQPPDCGFSDTVYWAGMVIFISGAVSLIAAMWSGVTTLSDSFHKGRPTSRQYDLANAATGEQPLAAVWLNRLAAPAPFQAPARRSNSDLGWADSSTFSSTVTKEVVPSPTPDHVVSSQGAVRVVATQAAVQFVPTINKVPRAPESRPALESLPAPAWYPDPERPEAIRWWDGDKWGESRPKPL